MSKVLSMVVKNIKPLNLDTLISMVQLGLLSGHTASATGIKVTFIFYYLLELQEPTTPLVLGLGRGVVGS